MFLDEKGRLFGKINIVDLFIILLIIFAAFAAFFRFSTYRKTSEGGMLEYTLIISGIRQMSVDALGKAEELVDAETSKPIGSIVSYNVMPAVQTNKKLDGTYAKVEVPDRFDVTLIVRGEGMENEKGYFLKEGKQLVPGDTFGISNGYVQTFGEVLKVRSVRD